MKIKDLKDHINDEVELTCLLKDVSESVNKYNNRWLDLVVSDSSGETTLKLWSEQMEENSSVQQMVGKVITVIGQVDLFQNRAGINIASVVLADSATYKTEDYFLSISTEEKGMLFLKMENLISEISSSKLRNLVSTILLVAKKAALMSSWYGVGHHVYLGGLLAHSVETAELAADMADQLGCSYGPYKSKVDKDLCIAGALLHDVGILSTTRDGKLNPRGFLVSSQVDSVLLVTAYNNQQKEKVEDLSHLDHVILMCEDREDLKPRTMEASIVRQANRQSIMNDQFNLSFFMEGRKKEVCGDTVYSKYLGTTIIRGGDRKHV